MTRTRIYLAALSSVAIVLASKGITDEGTVSLQGDMPRHMMNGVYFYDLRADGARTTGKTVRVRGR